MNKGKWRFTVQNSVNVPPEERVESLIHSATAEKLFNSVPKSNQNTVGKRLKSKFLFLEMF